MFEQLYQNNNSEVFAFNDFEAQQEKTTYDRKRKVKLCQDFDDETYYTLKECKPLNFWLDEMLSNMDENLEKEEDNTTIGSIFPEERSVYTPTSISSSDLAARKKRVKWTEDELIVLWKGIARFGNEWREVQKMISDRSYPQVKDKGRRLLQHKKWTTGKTKRDTDEARKAAKNIAKEVLFQLQTSNYSALGKKKCKYAVPVSVAQPKIEFDSTEFDDLLSTLFDR